MRGAAVLSDRLYSVPAAEVDYDLVRQFVLDAEAADLFTESLTFEAKEKRGGTNVAEAVGALSNTDGGIVLVGVKDRGAVGEDRIVGVPQSEHDALVSHLHGLIPNAMPQVIPVAKPGTDRLVIVLRVDADAVLHPVIVGGKVLYRIPGQKAPADRQRVIGLSPEITQARTSPGQCRSSAQAGARRTYRSGRTATSPPRRP
jgi:predicted HTH transcriptional regulator